MRMRKNSFFLVTILTMPDLSAALEILPMELLNFQKTG